MKNYEEESRGQRREHGCSRRAFRFEKFEAWQLARALNKSVDALSRGFPKEEMFALTSQVRRAAVSISANLVEGSGRNSYADFAHFLEIAYGSLMEPETWDVGVACRRQPEGRDSGTAGRQLVSQFFPAFDQEYIDERQLDSLLDDADLMAGKIVGLAKSLGRSPRISRPSTIDPRPSSQ